MMKASKIAREAGAEQIICAVYHSNDLAIRFYEAMGGQRIHDIFLMRLQLTSSTQRDQPD
jgi:ribosomal protein S18 acetylase RimI-like enzyme